VSHWTEDLTNVSQSVRERLMNTARETGENFQAVLIRYATERLMYRISRSDHQDRFVLKGAWLFYLWDIPRRTTRDVDFLGHGANSADDVEERFREIVQIQPDIDDGLEFDPQTVQAEQTQEEGAYAGVRVRVTARLGQARIPTRIDIGFGDALADTPVSTDLPVLLDLPAPHLRAYSAEAAVAEKLEAVVRFRNVNTRFKDFFDLYVLSRERTFEADRLQKQVAATFSRRDTDLPTAVPVGLGDEFGQSEASQQQWEAFLRSTDADGAPPEFSATLAEVREFAYPVLDAAADGRRLTGRWTPGEGWA
jgi:predicted nucleotidyltransferase component of viral defense system